MVSIHREGSWPGEASTDMGTQQERYELAPGIHHGPLLRLPPPSSARRNRVKRWPRDRDDRDIRGGALHSAANGEAAVDAHPSPPNATPH